MIASIMKEIKNHFARSVESQAFTITSNSIQGNFSEKYIAGMYVWIKNSYLNDGVYLLTGATANELTVADNTFTPEDLGDTIYIFACTPPRDFIELVSKIEAYKSRDGVTSESIDDYSVGFGGNLNGSDGSWKSAFSKQLNMYRKMWDDDHNRNLRKLGWQNRSGCY